MKGDYLYYYECPICHFKVWTTIAGSWKFRKPEERLKILKKIDIELTRRFEVKHHPCVFKNMEEMKE